MEQKTLQKIKETHGNSMKFSFDEECLYQPMGDDYSLVHRKDNIYLVSCWGEDIGYIVKLKRA